MSKDKDSKQKALQLTLDKLDKTYGKGTVMKMGDAVAEEIESISSGSLTLDYALGVGVIQREELLKFTARNRLVKLL
jgi:recombination protein RecA